MSGVRASRQRPLALNVLPVVVLAVLATGCGAVSRVGPPSITAAAATSGSEAEAPPGTSGGPEVHPRPLLPAVRPERSTAPRFLDRQYRAPATPSGRSGRGRGGVLRVPRLRITAPVDAVGLDHGAIAIPDDPGRLGWLTRSATVRDRIGSSVITGHVSDQHDVPGALASLHRIAVGDRIVWTVRGAPAQAFVVVRVRAYPRTSGLPASVFGVDGPHLLRLITCAQRRSLGGGGFHYTANLVVTARAVR